MNTWNFNLQTETNPVFRQGIHGLSRLLRLGEKSDCYPEIHQSSSLSWSVTDTQITLQWETTADLERLMFGMLGDFRHGVGVPPGYATSPEDVGFYVSARAHDAINGQIFREKKGACRSRSLDKMVDAFRTAFPHFQVVEEVSCAARKNSDNEDEPIRLKVTPHFRPGTWISPKGQAKAEQVKPPKKSVLAAAAKALNVDVADIKAPADVFARLLQACEEQGLPVPAELEAQAVSGEEPPLKIKKTFGVVYHPLLAKWNDCDIACTEQENFIASFACLAYAFTRATEGPVGLALDLPTFSLAERFHRKHAGQDALGVLPWVDGSERLAAWALASRLELPDGTYMVVSAMGVQWFSTKLPAQDASTRLRQALLAAEVPQDTIGTIRRLRMVPTRNLKTDKEPLLVSALDQILTNLQGGQSWLVGLEGTATVKRRTKASSDPHVGLFKSEAEIFAEVVHTLEDAMETQIRNEMRKVFVALGYKYESNFGKASKPWDRARKFVINTQLNRVTNAQSLMEALNQIVQEAGVGHSFTPDTFAAIWAMAEKQPLKAKALLSIACTVFTPKPKANAAGPVAEPELSIPSSEMDFVEEVVVD